jgi:hypothetical protein
MNAADIRKLLNQSIEFMDYDFRVIEEGERMFLQGVYDERDIVTYKVEEQRTRKWLLSPHMTKSEIVQTAFKLCLTSMEHRTREAFKYDGRRVFGPHYDVDALWELAGKREGLDYREPNDG